MCGRYTIKTPAQDIVRFFGLADIPELTPRFNVAPTQSVLCIREANGNREGVLLKWGLVPSWADDPAIGNRLINARAETVASKPAFRAAFKRRRCLVVADGFYEWQKVNAKTKQPWYFQLTDGEPFAFAGLWESWGEEDSSLETCTLITTEANELVGSVHERMPVILPPEKYDLWTNPALEGGKQLADLLRPYPDQEMTGYPVSTQVNSPRNDGPDLIEAVS